LHLARPWAENRGKEAHMIKKVKGGYKVLSEKGKNMGGPYKSKAAAAKRLRQVEFFKHRGS
jgi:phosphosulfolactate synthase (CoM biosynthesis protein A)